MYYNFTGVANVSEVYAFRGHVYWSSACDFAFSYRFVYKCIMYHLGF